MYRLLEIIGFSTNKIGFLGCLFYLSFGLQALYLNSTLVVNGTLNLEPGTIVKVGSNTEGISVPQGGTLSAVGTTGSPIVFTSYRDDSVGGDSNGDGSSSGVHGDYYTSVVGDRGVVNMEYVMLRNGHASFTANCSSGAGVVTLKDSELKSTVYLNSCKEGSLVLQRNHFEVPGNSYPISASSIDTTVIPLAGSNKNTFTGKGKAAVLYLTGSKVPAGYTWAVGVADGLQALYLSSGTPLTVNGTLNLEPGTNLKFDSNSHGISVVPSGTLNAIGTANDLITFTSYKDDSVGGDSNNNGSSVGAPGDYYTAVSGNGGVVNVEHAALRYGHMGIAMSDNGELSADYLTIEMDGLSLSDSQAEVNHTTIEGSNWAVIVYGGQANFASTTITNASYGLTVDNGAKVIFRGSFDDISNRAVTACNWDSNCSVDAAYVDWGSEDGPFIAGGNMVCGRASVSPWMVSSSTDSASSFDVENCNTNHATPAEQLSSSANYAHQAVAAKRIDCDNGLQDACDAIESYLACFGAAIQLAASQSPIPVTFDDPTETVDTTASTIANASNTFIQALEAESVPSFNLNVATGLLNVVNIYSALGSAYSSCAP